MLLTVLLGAYALGKVLTMALNQSSMVLLGVRAVVLAVLPRGQDHTGFILRYLCRWLTF